MNEAPIGTRLMFSTPAAITTSYAPAMTPCAAKWAACWEDPHWRSTVVPTVFSGKPAASAALRPTFTAWSPTCMTQPMITSSTSAGSMPVRSTSARSVCAARSTGWVPASLPLRRPSGVRTASTMTAVGMRTPEPIGETAEVYGHRKNPTQPVGVPSATITLVRDMDKALGDGGMPLLGQLGVAFRRYGEGWVEAAWTPTESACNPVGGVHGGVYAVIHDAAMNFATNSALERGESGATISITYSTMRGAKAGEAL